MKTREDGGKVSESLEEVVDYDAAYDDGYEAGYSEGSYHGYDEGYENGAKEADTMNQVLARAAINPLEPFVGRWDAPLRAWILTQDGREMIVRKEG